MAHPFFIDVLMYRLVIDPQQQKEQLIDLTPQQEHYLRNVIRLKNGDRFLTLNGLGKTWLTEFKDHLGYLIEDIEENRELSIPVTLMVALPKGNGFDEIVRCCTELGVSCLVPLISERTLLDPSSHKLERWRKISKEASEQSERQFIPEIIEPISFKDALKTFNFLEGGKYICVTRYSVDHLGSKLSPKPITPTVVVTGPEGGWTETEVNIAIEAEFIPVSLGNRILRAVTAPIFVMSLMSAILEGFEPEFQIKR